MNKQGGISVINIKKIEQLGGVNFIDKEDIINIIKFLQEYKTETDKIEVKTASIDFPKKCYDTFSSFSNRSGGVIIFGINEEDNFNVEGVYNIRDLQEKISSLCRDSLYPPISPEIIPFKLEGKEILVVKISELSQSMKPCYYIPKGLNKGSYIRIGDRDEVMSDYEIYDLQSYSNRIFEDKRLTFDAKLRDLDEELLQEYVDIVKRNKTNFSKYDFLSCLEVSGVIRKFNGEYYPTLAGNLVFGKYPQCFYPQLFVACVVVPGLSLGDKNTLGERFTDNKRVEGTIEEMITGTMNFLSRNMRTSVKIDSYGVRRDRTEYPIDALREAVTNALIHRDYSFNKEGAYISVYMYNDRIEITSPGRLYGSSKVEDLNSTKMMDSRNPTIVKILEEKTDILENRHSGIPTMIREMRKHGLSDPEFIVERDFFRVIFRNDWNNSETQNVLSEQVGEQVGEQVSEQVSEQSGEIFSNTSYNNSVLEYQIKLLNYCVIPKSTREIAKYLNIKSRRYLSMKIIKPLIEAEKLDYVNKVDIRASNQKYITVKKQVNLMNKV